MSNLPKKAEDRVNVFGIVLIGVASAILIWASAVALQAYYMSTAGSIETERDQMGMSKERRSVQATQQSLLNRLEHNAEYQKALAACVRNPVEVAMNNVVNDAQQGAESLVPAVGPHDQPTIEAIEGYPAPEAKPPGDDDGDPTAAIEGNQITISAPIEVGTDGKLELGSGAVIAAVAETLQTNPEISKVEIRSYTDDRGVEQDLLERTQGRAEAIKQALVKAGIDADRLEAVGKGSADPVGDNATEQGRAANNRVELEITGRSTPAPPGPDVEPEPEDEPEPADTRPAPDQPTPDTP